VIEGYEGSLVCAIQADKSAILIALFPASGVNLIVIIWVVDV
jgi:hypothetical protein